KQILMIQDPWNENITQWVNSMCSGLGLIAKPSLLQLTPLLQKLLDEQENIYILIDGLDECSREVQTDILSLFKDVLKQSSGTNLIKVYFASRTDLEVRKVINECVDFNIDQVTNRFDIRGFIERKLEK